jgi:hypothetical protein
LILILVQIVKDLETTKQKQGKEREKDLPAPLRKLKHTAYYTPNESKEPCSYFAMPFKPCIRYIIPKYYLLRFTEAKLILRKQVSSQGRI